MISGTVLRRVDSYLEVEIENRCIIRALADGGPAVRAGEHAVFSVRPAAIELGDGSAVSVDANRLEGTVGASAYHGSFVEYEIAALGQTIKARVSNPRDRPIFTPGESVTLLCPPQDIVLVPAD